MLMNLKLKIQEDQNFLSFLFNINHIFTIIDLSILFSKKSIIFLVVSIPILDVHSSVKVAE